MHTYKDKDKSKSIEQILDKQNLSIISFISIKLFVEYSIYFFI